MFENHPITLSEEQINRWLGDESTLLSEQFQEAARIGADQELEACCELLVADHWETLSRGLRAARRPKPPSLKEQAMAALDDAVMRGDCITISDALPTIRRALEALPE